MIKKINFYFLTVSVIVYKILILFFFINNLKLSRINKYCLEIRNDYGYPFPDKILDLF